jgi:glycosyltransferase involved in cell wall biosynthesis
MKSSFKKILKFALPKATQVRCRNLVQELKLTLNGNIQKFNSTYFDYLNPLSRKNDFDDFAQGPKLFKELFLNLKDQEISMNDLYWLKNDFIKILNNLTNKIYPLAKVYHSHTQGYAGFAASLAALQHKKTFFLTEHSLYLRDVRQYLEQDYKAISNTQTTKLFFFKAWSSWFELIGKWNYHRANKISYLYPKISEEAFALGSNKEVTTIIPNGICFEDFEDARFVQRNRQVSRFSPNHKWVFSLVGRIVPVKGILDIIETAHYLRTHWKKNFIFELVGPYDEDPIYFEECKRKVQDLKLESYIIFLGPKKVQEYLKEPDLILLSSHSEALPMAALEGMASGIPIISTDVGSVRDIILDPLLPCGFISPPQIPHELALQIIKLVNDQNLYTIFSENAIKRVQQAYNIKNVMNCYGSIYEELTHTTNHIPEELYA